LNSSWNGNTHTAPGGKGGYAKGQIDLSQNNIVYICVGQKGYNYADVSDSEKTDPYASSNMAREYGYNGGGCGHARGGGATHIALNSNRGELKNYSNDQSAVLIVAGGGGGNELTYNGEGGAGGGTSGGDGSGHLHSSIKNGSMQSGVREGAGYALITWQQLL